MNGSEYRAAPTGKRCAVCASPATIVKLEHFAAPDVDGFVGLATPFCDGCCGVVQVGRIDPVNLERYRMRK